MKFIKADRTERTSFALYAIHLFLVYPWYVHNSLCWPVKVPATRGGLKEVEPVTSILSVVEATVSAFVSVRGTTTSGKDQWIECSIDKFPSVLASKVQPNVADVGWVRGTEAVTCGRGCAGDDGGVILVLKVSAVLKNKQGRNTSKSAQNKNVIFFNRP